MEALLDIDPTAAQYAFEPATHPALHPGQSVLLRREGEPLGYLGALHPELLKQLDLQGPVYLFELDFAHGEQEKLRQVSKDYLNFRGQT